MSTSDAALRCPKCDGPVWDNRVGKRNPKAPDAKCRDRSCDGVIWKIKAPAGAEPAAAALAPASATPVPAPPARENLGACYLECVDLAIGKVMPRFAQAGVPMDAATLASVVATLFIQRCGRR